MCFFVKQSARKVVRDRTFSSNFLAEENFIIVSQRNFKNLSTIEVVINKDLKDSKNCFGLLTASCLQKLMLLTVGLMSAE